MLSRQARYLFHSSIICRYDTGFAMNSKIDKFDGACFDGCYVTGNIDSDFLEKLERDGRGTARRKGKLVSSLSEEENKDMQFSI